MATVSRSSSGRSRSGLRRRPPRPSYEVGNAASVRKCILKTMKQMMLCKEPFHFSININFEVSDVSTTSQAIADMTITKGEDADDEYEEDEEVEELPKSAKNLTKKFEDGDCSKKKTTNPPNKATVLSIPTGEFYAVRQCSLLLEGEEPAIREKGERDDATSNDINSLESRSTTSVGASSDALEKILNAVKEPLPTPVGKKAAIYEPLLMPIAKKAINGPLPTSLEKQAKPVPPPPAELRVVGGSFDVQKGAKGKTDAVMTIHCPKCAK